MFQKSYLEPLKPRRLSRTARKRDEQIRRLTRRLRLLCPVLADAKYTPALRSYSMITLLIERSYAELKHKLLLNPETGELRTSIDVIRRLAETQKNLGHELGLSPSAAPLLAKPVSVLDIESIRDETE